MSKETTRYGLTLIRPGRWLHRSGRLIIQTDWDGPRGGTKRLWEVASEGPYGPEIDGHLGERTLRDQAAALDREEANE